MTITALVDQQKVHVSACADTGFRFEDLPRAMIDRYGLQERVTGIHALAGWVNLHINLRGLFNAKAILVEEQWYYLIANLGDKVVHTFPRLFVQKWT